jgi:hypothetical protein
VLPYPSKDTPINKKKYFVKFHIWNRINYNHNLHFQSPSDFSFKKEFLMKNQCYGKGTKS